jgi:hypothetical protein
MGACCADRTRRPGGYFLTAVVRAGAVIVNTSGRDGADPALESVTLAVPMFTSKSAETVAVSRLDETMVVASGVPFQLMVEPFKHLDPVTVSVNDALPAALDAGLSVAIVGVAGFTVNVCDPLVTALPPMIVVTVTGMVVGVQT